MRHTLNTVTRRVASVAAIAVAGVGLAAGSAGADDATVRVAAPAGGALITSNDIAVVLKLGPKVTRIKLYAGSRDVSARVRLQGRIATASIPRSAVKGGANRLLVESYAGKKRIGAARRRVLVGTAFPGLVTVRSGAAARSAVQDGPGKSKRFAPQPGSLLVAASSKVPTYATLSVNGHQVYDLRAGSALTRHTWVPSTLDGLRPGTNRVVLSAHDAKGRYTVKRWTVRRSAALPLVEAGRERVVRPRAWSALSARGTRATRKHAGLAYAWRVVTAPKGAKPQLRNATTARPSFRPDKPGVYQVALRARHVVKGGKAAAADASSSAEDVVTLDAGPTAGITAQGLYIDTTPQAVWNDPNNPPQPSFTIGGTTYTIYNDGYGPFQISIQLDATTFAPLDVESNILTPTAGVITINQWYGSPTSPLVGTQVYSGTTLVASNGTNQFPPASPGNVGVKGWMAADDGTSPTMWTSADMLPFKTRATTDGATSNTMEVNGQQYASSLASGATSGFQLVVLDSSGTPVNGTPAVYSFDGNANDDNGQITALTAALKAADTTDQTVMLQSIGAIKDPEAGTATAWQALAAEIQALGGNQDVVNLLNGTVDGSGGGYALVAANAGKAAEASMERTKVGGTLSGLLTRNANGVLEPDLSDPAAPDPLGSTRYAFQPLVYGAPTSWANWVRTKGSTTLSAPTAAQSAALSNIVSQAVSSGYVGATGGCAGAPDQFRAAYCNTVADQLVTLQNHLLRDISYDSQDGQQNNYTQSDFNTAQATLNDELDDVINIRAGITAYQGLFDSSLFTSSSQIGQINTAIAKTINNVGESTTSQYLAMTSDLLWAFGVEPETGDILNAVGGTLSLIADSDAATNPAQDILADEQITQANDLSDLATAFQDAASTLNFIGDYAVSDPVKLQQLSQAMSVGQFSLNSNNSAAVADGLEFSVQKYLWGTMLSTGYVWYSGELDFTPSPYCQKNPGTWVRPFANVAPSGYWAPPGRADQLWFGPYDASAPFPEGPVFSNSNVGLPGSITDNLFTPVNGKVAPSGSGGPVGAVMPYFAQTYFQEKTLPKLGALKDSYNGCNPGGAPK
ncbi:MAG TPA: hypothetical protein VMT10_05810 [Solirubrobacteraceae bacterium]|nr:hypothetical protein [Solirubrobacteraceae bacterium]